LSDRKQSGMKERRWGMVIDLDRCTGCGACVAACKVENNIPEVAPEEAASGRVIQWMRIARHEKVEHGHTVNRSYPVFCFHCKDAPCTLVCPVHATFQGIDGIIGQVYSRCIGCRYCMAACPYTVKFFNWYEPEWTPSFREHTNPDVSLREMGVVEKCTFCSHRLLSARDTAACEDRDVREDEYQPACVEICPAQAIMFGDLADSDGAVAKKSRSPRAFELLEELGTGPAVSYLAEREHRV